MIFFSLLGNEIRLYISEHGNDGNKCQINSPCSFQSSLKLIKNETILCFTDNIYKSQEQILKFQNFSKHAISKGGILNGNSLIIDGSFFNDFDFFPAYLTFEFLELVDTKISLLSILGYQFYAHVQSIQHFLVVVLLKHAILILNLDYLFLVVVVLFFIIILL